MTPMENDQDLLKGASSADAALRAWQRPLLSPLGEVRLLTEAGSHQGKENLTPNPGSAAYQKKP